MQFSNNWICPRKHNTVLVYFHWMHRWQAVGGATQIVYSSFTDNMYLHFCVIYSILTVEDIIIKVSNYIVEPRLSNCHLSIPLIIWNDVQKFLKQLIPNC